jgi:hypothetical protein
MTVNCRNYRIDAIVVEAVFGDWERCACGANRNHEHIVDGIQAGIGQVNGQDQAHRQGILVQLVVARQAVLLARMEFDAGKVNGPAMLTEWMDGGWMDGWIGWLVAVDLMAEIA